MLQSVVKIMVAGCLTGGAGFLDIHRPAGLWRRTMRRLALVLMAVLCASGGPAVAQERVTLGWGRLFSNDAMGDGQDRWRTGSYAVSRIRGARWDGVLPGGFGEILEFRLRADTISPENLEMPAAADRRYAGAITVGLHSQFAVGGFEADVGGDLVFVGPQTGVGDFQSWVHGVLGLGEVGALNTQIDDAVYPTLSGEIARRFRLGERAELRPFIEARAGDETLVRAGGDLVIGTFGRTDLMLRDVATGQRYRAVTGETQTGVSLVLGGDIARVFDSNYLPDGGSVTASETRQRLRAGVHWQGTDASVFYGVTYLSPEFDAQDEGQTVGSLALIFRF